MNSRGGENAAFEKTIPKRAASTVEFAKLKPTRISLFPPDKTLTTSSGASSVAAATMAAGAAMVFECAREG